MIIRSEYKTTNANEIKLLSMIKEVYGNAKKFFRDTNEKNYDNNLFNVGLYIVIALCGIYYFLNHI